MCIWENTSEIHTVCKKQWNHILSWTRKTGYNVGFTKDDYGCNTNQCECAHFDNTVFGKLNFVLISLLLKALFRRHCCIQKNSSQVDNNQWWFKYCGVECLSKIGGWSLGSKCDKWGICYRLWNKPLVRS